MLEKNACSRDSHDNFSLVEVRPSPDKLSWSAAHGTLPKTRRQRQRQRHETRGLMSRTIAVNVRYIFWYISLPSSAKQQREMTVFVEALLQVCDLPISFTQIFQTGNQIHQHSTRYSDYYRPHTSRINIKKISILFQGPRIWNSLPIDIKNAPTLSIFKRTIKPFLRVRQNAT